MERTTVYLDAQLKRRLKDASNRLGKSEAFLIREALSRYLPGRAATELRPVGCSTDGGVADRDEEALEESGFGKR